MTLDELIKAMEMSDEQEILNSLAKGGGSEYDWNTEVSLDSSKGNGGVFLTIHKEKGSEKRELVFCLKVHSDHILYEGSEYANIEETTYDLSEDYSVLLKFILKKERSEKGDTANIYYPNTSNSNCYIFCNCPHFHYFYRYADSKFVMKDYAKYGVKSWTDLDPNKNKERRNDYSSRDKKNPENKIGGCKHIIAAICYLLSAIDTKFLVLTKEERENKDLVESLEDSTFVTDTSGLLSRIEGAKVSIPLYAGTQEERRRYMNEHRKIIAKKHFENITKEFLRAKTNNDTIGKRITQLKNERIRLEKEQEENTKKVQDLASRLKKMKKGTAGYRKINSELNSVWKNGNKISKDINKANGSIFQLKKSLANLGDKELQLIKYRKQLDAALRQSKKRVIHPMSVGKYFRVRKEPNEGKEKFTIKDINRFLDHMDDDIDNANYIIKNSTVEKEVNDAKEVLAKSTELKKKWSDIKAQRLEDYKNYQELLKQRKIEKEKRKADREKEKKIKKAEEAKRNAARKEIETRKSGLLARTKSVEHTLSTFRHSCEDDIKSAIKDKKAIKPVDITKLYNKYSKMIDDLDKDKDKLLKDVAASDFYNTKDHRKEVSNSINKSIIFTATRGMLIQVIERAFAVNFVKTGEIKVPQFIKDKIKKDVEEKLKGSTKKAKDAEIKRETETWKEKKKLSIQKYVKLLLNGKSEADSNEGDNPKKPEASIKNKTNAAKQSATNKKDLAKKGLEKNLTKTKKDKKLSDDQLAELKKEKIEMKSRLEKASNKFSAEVGMKQKSDSYDFLNKYSPLEKIVTELAKLSLKNKKEGKSLDLRNAIVNKYRTPFLMSVQKQTGYSIKELLGKLDLLTQEMFK